MVALEESGGPPTIAARGLTPEEAARPPSSGAGGALPPGPITVSYRYGAADAADTDLIRGGLFVPLVGRESHALGSLALFWRTPGYEPTQQRVAAVEQIAATCIPAIENARRYREARQLAETDALTGFFNQRYFHETLRRESLRAQRYDRNLALLILDLDDFKAVNDRIGHLAGDAVLAQVAERLRNEIRSVDVGCRVGGDEFAVIMPESSSEDGEQLFQRMHDAVATMSVPGGGRVQALRRDRGAPPRRDGCGSLRAGRLRPLPREGSRQGPSDRRDGLTRTVRQPRTAEMRIGREGRSGDGALSSVTPTRAPRGTSRSRSTGAPRAGEGSREVRRRRVRQHEPRGVEPTGRRHAETVERQHRSVTRADDERDPSQRAAQRDAVCVGVGEGSHRLRPAWGRATQAPRSAPSPRAPRHRAGSRRRRSLRRGRRASPSRGGARAAGRARASGRRCRATPRAAGAAGRRRGVARAATR